jgi:hypothetical protein
MSLMSLKSVKSVKSVKKNVKKLKKIKLYFVCLHRPRDANLRNDSELGLYIEANLNII